MYFYARRQSLWIPHKANFIFIFLYHLCQLPSLLNLKYYHFWIIQIFWKERLWILKTVREVKGQEPIHTNCQIFYVSRLRTVFKGNASHTVPCRSHRTGDIELYHILIISHGFRVRWNRVYSNNKVNWVCHLLNYVPLPLKFICWNRNSQYLRIWHYIFTDRDLKLKWDH